MPHREEMRERIVVAQLANGYLFPNALLQHAIEDLEKLSIDVGALERRRDRMVPALRAMGYECSMPEGTFYLMAKAPTDDDVAFCGALADNDVLVLPGTVVEVPGWFRSRSPRATRWWTRPCRPSNGRFGSGAAEVGNGAAERHASRALPSRTDPGIALCAGSLAHAQLLCLDLVQTALHVIDRLVEALAGRSLMHG